MHSPSLAAVQPASGTQSPDSNFAAPCRAVPNPSALSRVGEVLQGISAAREITDAELRQHAMDCTHLMEVAYQRFQEHQNPADRDEAVLWMHRRDEALRDFSRRGHTFVEMGR